MDTWGKRCHQLFFMVGRVEGSEPSEKANFSANAQMVQLDMNDTYMKLWQKTKLAFKYIYQHHIADADWILKVLKISDKYEIKVKNEDIS